MNLKLFNKLDPNAEYKLIKNNKYKGKRQGLKPLAEDYDSFGFISNSLGKELENLFKDDNYIIGIHRTGYSNVTDNFIDDVFTNGLINNGDIMQGVVNSNIDIEKTVSIINRLELMVGSLKACHSYKDSEGAFIIKIPREYLDRDNQARKGIYSYSEDSNTHRLLGEYIYGFVETKEKGIVSNLEKNYNYKDIHTYNDEKYIQEGAEINNNIRHR